MQDTAIKVAINHLPHIGSEKAILLSKTLFIDLLKRLEMVFNALVILRILRLARTINRRCRALANFSGHRTTTHEKVLRVGQILARLHLGHVFVYLGSWG